MAWKKLVMLVLLFALCFPRASLPQEEIPLEDACKIELLLISRELIETSLKLDVIKKNVAQMEPSHADLPADTKSLYIRGIKQMRKDIVSDCVLYLQYAFDICMYEADLLTATALLIVYEEETSRNVRTKFSLWKFIEGRKSSIKSSQKRTTMLAAAMEMAWDAIHDKALLQKLFEAKNVILSTMKVYDKAIQTLEAYISHEKEQEKKTRNRSY